MTDLQTTHPIVRTNSFATVESYISYLLHRKAYEYAGEMMRERSLLDWGCNDGYGLELLKGFTSQLAGLDSAEDSVRAARQRLPELSSMIQIYDGARLPFPASSFDVVTSFQVIEHVTDLRTYLSHIVEVLKQGGVAIFTTPNKLLRLDPGDKPWNPFHVREFLPSELRELLSCHFATVDLRGLRGTPEIESIERKRCAASKKAAKQLLPPFWKVRSAAVATTKRILPEVISERLRGLLRPTQPSAIAQQLSGEVLSNFSTSDMFYSTEDIENALDLMAVCSK
jgi:SAM-dependent methyltransferase